MNVNNPHMYENPDMMFLMMKQFEDDYQPKGMYKQGLFKDDYKDYCEQPYQMPYKQMYEQDELRPIVEEVKTCAMVCHRMISNLINKDYTERRRQMSLLHDCANICDVTAVSIVTNSKFSRPHAKLCAMICEECGEECMRHPDRASQHCARVCLSCARACMEYARM